LSDFIAPLESGVKDYIGIFAVSSGFGVEELSNKFKNNDDDYNSILCKAVADRLSEAFAEKMHLDVRRQYWGYEKNYHIISTAQELHKIKYDGIRPAPGYPSQPDPTEQTQYWKLLNVKENVSMELTEHFAIYPAASVSGLY